jgi:NADH-quinone oxidoreductase subunit L
MTNAFFKALLFLAAGSVIIAMHHDQDMRNMGGLRKYMPITWITSLIGSLALIGTPGFAGFFSKDSIIEAVGHSTLWGSGFAYFALLFGVFITALYSFRMYFMVFHGKERMDEHTREHLHETPWVVTGPLIALAIPSVIIGAIFVGPMAFGDFFKGAIYVAPAHDVLGQLAEHFHGWWRMVLHSFGTAPFWLAAAGVGTAYYLYMVRTDLPEVIATRFAPLYRFMQNKYGFDDFNEWFFAGGSKALGRGLWRFGDVAVIDGFIVNGSARVVAWVSAVVRTVQTGYLYHYAFAMILGLLLLFGMFVIGAGN